MQRCHVYARRGAVIVAGQAQTVAGFWIWWPPFTKVPQDSPEIGALVLVALDATAHQVRRRTTGPRSTR